MRVQGPAIIEFKQSYLSIESFKLVPRPFLDEGPRSSDHWIQAILLVQSFKLVPRPFLDEGPRSSDQWIQAILLVQSFKLVPRPFLDEGSRSNNQWIQAILLIKSFKLVPRPLDEGPRPKSGELRLNLQWHLFCLEGKINWLRPKKTSSARRKEGRKESCSWFGEPRIRLVTKKV
jgi:hypothetical protein